MAWSLKTKRSAGVPVTKRVGRLIESANQARDSGDWASAAQYYEEALRRDPSLYHIWLQLGHAHKENANFRASETGYIRATELRPADGEPHLHLGHLRKVARDRLGSGRAYLRAVQLDPANSDAVSELHRLVAVATGPSRERMLDALLAALGNVKKVTIGLHDVAVDKPDPISDGLPVLIFDISDLISYFGRARLPTGIQRVQIETITSVLAAPERRSRICCVLEGRDEWVEVPAEPILTVVELSQRSSKRDDPAWLGALNQLWLALAFADPIEFPQGACLINLGTSWWLQNYFLRVRTAQIAHGLRYFPLIYDLIPVLMPEHCIDSLIENFISWLVGVFDHAAGFLAISEATKRDLIRVARELGYDLDPAKIKVVRLDADFRRPALEQVDRSTLRRWELDHDNFVLFVSTIESRKGHIVALDAWAELIRRHGADAVPRLVCVGAQGWLNTDVYERVAGSAELTSRVMILSGLADADLALFYSHCLFAIYPSLYEGWGLPITEALCYGKPVIASDSSSLPEAGGDFALYVKAGSVSQLADAVERMSFNSFYRRTAEQKIVREFKPRTWQAITSQIGADVSELATNNPYSTFVAPKAVIGAYHSIGRGGAMRVWSGLRSGEIFRTGVGWFWPDAYGCWTREEGGELTIGLPEGRDSLRVAVQVRGLPTRNSRWRLLINHKRMLTGALPAGQSRWISFDHSPHSSPAALHLHLAGDLIEQTEIMRGDLEQDAEISIGVLGFFISKRSDADARAAFIEAVTLNAVSDLDAYRENRESRPPYQINSMRFS